MKGICPNCEKETELELIQKEEDINVRGEVIKVEVKYYKCKSCGEEFEDPKSDEDPLDKAYRLYRRKHEMMQPEEIRDFRKKFGITQNEMSRLLGWGGATLSRYENGALQDETHEKVLRLAMEPRNLLKLLEGTPDALPEEKKGRLIHELQAAEEETCSLERVYEERFGKYEASNLSGYRRLDLAKLFNAILYFCKGGVFKTKLNKLLFYADFKHFKDYALSITGARYAHIPFGPAPEKYSFYIATLLENGVIGVKEHEFSEQVIGEEFFCVKEPDLSLFTDSELKILSTVKEYFKDFNSKRITDFSHSEKAYMETAQGDKISYEYASDLKI
jgi:putative zinc finger/helix-turn-helix YgiT family protein